MMSGTQDAAWHKVGFFLILPPLLILLLRTAKWKGIPLRVRSKELG